jgi:hypothetical protein
MPTGSKRYASTVQPHGHHLRLISFVPTARRPEEQVRFEVVLDSAALERLRDAIAAALAGSASGQAQYLSQ